VRHATDGFIWIRGKVCNEDAPILEETLALLVELAKDLQDDDLMIRTRLSAGAGDDTIDRDAMDVLERAGFSINVHGLRRTFATIVAESSSDEMLAMRLIRDRLPGQTGRYIKRDLGELLNRHTPLHLLRGSVDRVPGGLPTASEETWRECVGVEPTPD
jgi:integrase